MIMRLLVKTYSCHPWTVGEIIISRKASLEGLHEQAISLASCSAGHYLSGLADLVVLVDNTVFPNFKEEINV